MPTTSSELGLSTPTAVADRAVAVAAEHLSPYVFNHSVRCFLYVAPTARAADLLPGRDYDEELVFLICLLHDLGMSRIEGGHQRFELDGADMARRFLLDHDVTPERADTDNGDRPAHRRPGARGAAETPDELADLFVERFVERDLDGLVAL